MLLFSIREMSGTFRGRESWIQEMIEKIFATL